MSSELTANCCRMSLNEIDAIIERLEDHTLEITGAIVRLERLREGMVFAPDGPSPHGGPRLVFSDGAHVDGLRDEQRRAERA